ncbi:hypothetical protein RIF29_09655 [Crotalaria pallida]|uniref:Uncharacterized protein n=1 Tax=Crotalaria pallida TaxID=3830 RepID=A0AAN9FS14_CROPI
MPPGSDQLEAIYHTISLSRYHTISSSNWFMILISSTTGFGSIYVSFLASIIGDSGENLVKSTRSEFETLRNIKPKFDEYLGDLVDCNSCGDNNQFNAATYHYGQQNQHQQQHYGVPHKTYAEDSVVPVHQHQQGQYFQLGLVFESSKAGFSFNGSISQSDLLSVGYTVLH